MRRGRPGTAYGQNTGLAETGLPPNRVTGPRGNQ